MKENNIEKITVMKDLEILYEDNHIIAVNKQISDIVQEDPSGDTPLSEKVKAYIKREGLYESKDTENAEKAEATFG